MPFWPVHFDENEPKKISSYSKIAFPLQIIRHESIIKLRKSTVVQNASVHWQEGICRIQCVERHHWSAIDRFCDIVQLPIESTCLHRGRDKTTVDSTYYFLLAERFSTGVTYMELSTMDESEYDCKMIVESTRQLSDTFARTARTDKTEPSKAIVEKGWINPPISGKPK